MKNQFLLKKHTNSSPSNIGFPFNINRTTLGYHTPFKIAYNRI